MSASRAIQFDPAFLAEFEILSELSAGGFGVVHIARQRSLDRRVAVKFPLVDDAELLGRFEDEARMLASLDHPSIVQVYAWGKTGGHPYLVEELIEGLSLRDLLGRRGQLAPLDAMPIARDLADALSYVHSKGLVHRDLKPSNVLMSATGAKLIDFGIARDCGRDSRTQFGVILGTPEYLAPELLQGSPAGPPADVYSLGAVLFEMLCGSRPIQADDLPTLLSRRLQEDAPTLSAMGLRVDRQLEALVGRMLDRAPARRPSIRRAVLPLLEELLHGDSGAGVAVAGPDPLDATALATDGSASGIRPPARPGRAALTSVSRIKAARPESLSRVPAATAAFRTPVPKRWPWALALALLVSIVPAVMLVRGRLPAPRPPPEARVVALATPAPPAPLSPQRAEAERLLAQAERPGPADVRLAAYYGVCSRVGAAGPSAGWFAPGRLEGLRSSLLTSGSAGGEAAAALLKLLETRNSLSPAGEVLASKDLVSRYPGAAVDELAARLAELQLHTRGMELGRAIRAKKLAVDRLELEATSRQFAGTPGGRLWRALAADVPSLLARSELPLGPRQSLARVFSRTRGLELLYRRAGLPPLIEPESALAKVMSFWAVPLAKPPLGGAPAQEVTALAGAAGESSDLHVSKPGEEAFVHKDAETWFFGALGRGYQLPSYRENLTLRSVALPARVGSRPAGSFTFVAWVGDLDPEDGFMVKFFRPGDKESGLNLPLWRPDVRGSCSGHLLCVVRVSEVLLPAGTYDVLVEPWRWVIQRQILKDQEGMVSRLMRLTLAVQ